MKAEVKLEIAAAVALAAFTAGSGYVDFQTNPSTLSHADVLGRLNITDHDLTAWNKTPSLLAHAQSDLEYVPPNTRCNTSFGFTTGCDPEKFPDPDDALKNIRQAVTLLSQGKASETDIVVLSDVESSITVTDPHNPFREPISVTTYSPQRQALKTESDELRQRYTDDNTKITDLTDNHPNTLNGFSMLGAVFGMFGAIGMTITAIVRSRKKEAQKTPSS